MTHSEELRLLNTYRQTSGQFGKRPLNASSDTLTADPLARAQARLDAGADWYDAFDDSLEGDIACICAEHAGVNPGELSINDDMLRDTLGPQFNDIIDLARDIEHASPDDLAELQHAGDRAPALALANRDQTNTAGALLGRAVRRTVRVPSSATLAAIDNAALALSTRHLIGQGEYTQSHYYALTYAAYMLAERTLEPA